MNIIVDVDLTLIDVVTNKGGWLDWLQNATKFPYEQFPWDINQEMEIEYDLTKYYPDIPKKEAWNFWQDPNLYQRFKPYADAVEVLTKLGLKNKIVFVSYCKQFHQKSKYMMLEEYFKHKLPKGNFAFLATREKWAVSGDVIIDDRNGFLSQFASKPEVVKIKYATPYTQDEDLKCSIDLETSDWYVIGQYLEDIL